MYTYIIISETSPAPITMSEKEFEEKRQYFYKNHKSIVAIHAYLDGIYDCDVNLEVSDN